MKKYLVKRQGFILVYSIIIESIGSEGLTVFENCSDNMYHSRQAIRVTKKSTIHINLQNEIHYYLK